LEDNLWFEFIICCSECGDGREIDGCGEGRFMGGRWVWRRKVDAYGDEKTIRWKMGWR
jgi:hypothetical protein